MKINKENKKLLRYLSDWNDDFYDLEKIHDLEFHNQFSKFNDINLVLGCDAPKELQDEFYDFANNGEGGSYCLWFYPNLDGEAPVVFAGMDGERCTVASSFKEFAYLLTQGIALKVAGIDFESDGTESPWNDFVDFEPNSKEVQASIENFKDQLGQVCDLGDASINVTHPNFAQWIEKNKVVSNQKTATLDLSNIALESGKNISLELIEAVQKDKISTAIKIFRNLKPGTGVSDGRDAFKEISSKLLL